MLIASKASGMGYPCTINMFRVSRLPANSVAAKAKHATDTISMFWFFILLFLNCFYLKVSMIIFIYHFVTND